MAVAVAVTSCADVVVVVVVAPLAGGTEAVVCVDAEVAEGASVVVPFIFFWEALCDDRGGGEQGDRRRLSSCSTDAAGACTCSFVF